MYILFKQRRQIIEDVQTQEEHTRRHPPIRFDEARSGYSRFGQSKIGGIIARGRRSQRMGRRQQ